MSFKIGQKVVCIDDSGNSLKRNEIYTVMGNSECPKCNAELIYVGVSFLFKGQPTKCGSCGRIYSSEKAWSRASRFRPIDYSFGEMVAESITKECEKETVKEVY